MASSLHPNFQFRAIAMTSPWKASQFKLYHAQFHHWFEVWEMVRVIWNETEVPYEGCNGSKRYIHGEFPWSEHEVMFQPFNPLPPQKKHVTFDCKLPEFGIKIQNVRLCESWNVETTLPFCQLLHSCRHQLICRADQPLGGKNRSVSSGSTKSVVKNCRASE